MRCFYVKILGLTIGDRARTPLLGSWELSHCILSFEVVKFLSQLTL